MQPGDISPPFDVVAIFLPVIGLVALLVFQSMTTGATRRMVLVLGPFLLGLAMWYVGPAVMGNVNGQYLGSLLALLLYGAAYIAIALYYLVLPFVAIALRQRAARAAPQQP
ncbi:MAG: hypothetical protein KDC48_17135 [Planctomycetes bacterium]|nr:hypothetical protein [Planctomycetota bacterium]